MSLKSELQAIDGVELARQAIAYDSRMESLLEQNSEEHDSDAVAVIEEYTALNVLAYAVATVFSEKDLPAETVANITAGASFVLSVLTDYAELKELPPTL